MTERRLNLQDAAGELGITPDALRQRIRRGQYRSEKSEGRVYVYLPADRTETEQDMLLESNALTSQLMDRVAFLERELDVRSEEIRRRDTIIMNMTEAMKAISPPAQEGPPEPREAPQTATEQPGRVEPQTPIEGAMSEHPQPRRSWWRRMFGG